MSSTSDPAARERPFPFLALIVVALFALGPYVGALDNGFAFDDEQYVRANPALAGGVSGELVRWAFTTGYAANWHPLTWISHAADVGWFGLAPAGHHLVGLLWHVANSLLLLLLLRALTGSVWASALVAAAFAAHPAHVESVAWISERKDVLSTFFWLLTTLAYVSWTRRGGGARYLLVLLAFALGLLGKQMLVTLPFTLLLLDVWPLGRAGPGRWTALVREKLPLFLLSIGASIATFVAQRGGGAVGDLTSYPLGTRLANAAVAYVAYLGKLFLPRDLCAFYPYDAQVPAWKVAGALALVLAISVLVLRSRATRPYLVFGWLFYLGTLVPVIGLVQIGEQAMADRYTYVPSIGIFVAVVWLARDWLASRTALCVAAGVGAGAVLLVLAGATARQVRVWKDEETLFRHALAVTRDNYLAHYNLGFALITQQRDLEASKEFEAALAIKPDHSGSLHNLGRLRMGSGDFEGAVADLRRAIGIKPDVAFYRVNLAFALAGAGRTDEARTEFEAGRRLDPTLALAAGGLGASLARFGAVMIMQGRMAPAAALLSRAVEVDAGQADAQLSLGHALASQGRVEDAERCYRRAIELAKDPTAEYFVYGRSVPAQAHFGLGNTLAAKGALAAAVAAYRRALELAPGFARARVALATVLSTAEDPSVRASKEALELASQASRALGGTDAGALDALAAACADQQDFPRARVFVELARNAARRAKSTRLEAEIAARAELYAEGKPFRQASVPLMQ